MRSRPQPLTSGAPPRQADARLPPPAAPEGQVADVAADAADATAVAAAAAVKAPEATPTEDARRRSRPQPLTSGVIENMVFCVCGSWRSALCLAGDVPEHAACGTG